MVLELNLRDMHIRHRGLTVSISGTFGEAASVCLNRHHTSPTDLVVLDNGNSAATRVTWVVPDEILLGAWANETVATEYGACGCVIAAIEQFRNFFAVRRAETGTGADYYVGPAGSGEEDLENCLRLEISGVDRGSDKEVAKRLLQKVAQARRGESDLPAIAGVIGFEAKRIMLMDVSGEP
jgi:hypothetical protein